MKKILKKFTLLLVALCMTLTSVLLVACDNQQTPPVVPPDDVGTNDPPQIEVDYGDPLQDGYIITLVYPDGKPVKGTESSNSNTRVGIRLTKEDGTVIEGTTAKINVSGVGIINYKTPGVYKVEVLNCPNGYAPDEDTFFTTVDKACHTLTLAYAPPTAYTVNVTMPDGSPAVNRKVNFIEGSTTVASVRTDDKGVAVTPSINRRVYDVVVDGVTNLIHRAVKSTVAADPVNIQLLEYHSLDFNDADKLNEETVKPWDDELNIHNPTNPDWSLIRFNVDGNNYAYKSTIHTDNVDGKEVAREVFYSFTAPKTGAYRVGSKRPANGNADYEIKFYLEGLNQFDNSVTINSKTNNGNNISAEIRVEKGEKLYFSVTTDSGKAGEIDFIICHPVPAPLSTTATAEGDYTITYEDYNTAILSFTPTKSGVYKVTSDTAYDVQLVKYANYRPIPLSNGETSDLTGEYAGYVGNDNGPDGRNFEYEETFTAGEIGGTVDFHIIIKDATINYPAQVKITIKRVRDVEETIVTKKTATTSNTTKYGDQQGTFTWMPADGSIETIEENGLWYAIVNNEKKPLVVAITKNLVEGDRKTELEYSFATIEYKGEEGGITGGEAGDGRKNTNLTVFEDLSKQDIAWVYTDFIKTYSSLVNKDGVYEVNSELKLFLERYMNQRFHDIIHSTIRPAQPWLLGCGYYA